MKLKRIILIFIFALLLRLSLCLIAFHGDLNNNISWGKLAIDRGFANFYEGGQWPYSSPNQPPLTILLFSSIYYTWLILQKIIWWVNINVPPFPSKIVWFWEDHGLNILIKIPSILADLGIGFLIFNYLNKLLIKNQRKALIITCIWLFNPIVWYNSSIWGQTDSIVNFLGLTSVYYLLNKKLNLFALFLTSTFLFKGSLIIFLPLLFIVVLSQKYNLKEFLNAILVSLSTIIITSVYFHPKIDLLEWLIKLYKNRIFPGEIGYLTANSFNLWWLINPGNILDTIKFFGISARLWGLVVLLVTLFYLVSFLIHKVNDKRIFLSLAIISLSSFLFMTRMHERYLYPFFPYATILLGFIPELFLSYVILSLTNLLNLYHLFWAPPIPMLEKIYSYYWVPVTISFVNIISFFFILRLLKSSKL